MAVLSYPLTVGWAVTNECNLKCKHCSQNSGTAETNKEELDTFQILKVIKELARNKAFIISYTGGEPFCRNDFIDIVKYTIANGLRTIINTNGTLCNEDVIKNDLTELSEVRISLDSCIEDKHDKFRNKPGTYKKAINSIETFRRYGVPVKIVTTLSKMNIDEIDMFSDLVKYYDVEWGISILLAQGRGKSLKELLLSKTELRSLFEKTNYLRKEKKVDVMIDSPYSALLREVPDFKSEKFCAAATSLAVISDNGDVSPCFYVDEYGGNIKTSTLKDIWKNSKIFNDFRAKSLLKGKCSLCKYKNPCGGCRASAYAETGDYLEGDSLCWIE